MQTGVLLWKGMDVRLVKLRRSSRTFLFTSDVTCLSPRRILIHEGRAQSGVNPSTGRLRRHPPDMAPSRRAKKVSPTAKVTPSALQVPHKEDARSPNDDASEKQDTPGAAVKSEGSASHSHSIEAFDPALLDEEEVPGEHDDAHAGPRSTHAAGVEGYNTLKSFNGQVYSGMAVGGSHTWNYDQGVWKETKAEPDLWKIDYQTTKRRAKKAPKGSGAPVGTEYHWLIVAHQVSFEHSG